LEAYHTGNLPPPFFPRDVTRHGTAITRLHLTPILLIVITVPKVLSFYTQAATYSIVFRLQRYAPTDSAFGFSGKYLRN